MLFDNHKFTSYYATLRWLVGIQKSGEPAVIEFLRGRVLGAFGIVEKHLATRAFMLGDEPTIADFSLVGYHYYDEADDDRSRRFSKHPRMDPTDCRAARLEASLRADASQRSGGLAIARGAGSGVSGLCELFVSHFTE